MRSTVFQLPWKFALTAGYLVNNVCLCVAVQCALDLLFHAFLHGKTTVRDNLFFLSPQWCNRIPLAQKLYRL